MTVFLRAYILTLISFVAIDGYLYKNNYQSDSTWDRSRRSIIGTRKFGIDFRPIYKHEMLLFPNVGLQPINDSSIWKIIVHGWTYNNRHRNKLIEASALIWITKLTKGLVNAAENFYSSGSIQLERLQPFFVTDEPYQQVKITIGDKVHVIYTNKYGQYFQPIDITNDDMQKVKQKQSSGDSIVKYELMNEMGENATGIIRLIEPGQGISFISDIDDTIKISEVFDKIRLIANTFIFPFKPVPGMATLYQQWKNKYPSSTFHYLSGMPDQLYKITQEFINENNFPDGTFHMRHFRMAITSMFKFLYSQSTIDHKMKYLRFFLTNTTRDFVLIGDSGEKDPEIYGAITREYPERIRAIFIRAVHGESMLDGRFQNAFQNIPQEKWLVFSKPEQIPIDLSKAPGNFSYP